jgi:cell division protein FtsQ
MLPRLESQDPRQLQRADLRYTNGFALIWRALPPAGPPVSVTQAKS